MLIVSIARLRPFRALRIAAESSTALPGPVRKLPSYKGLGFARQIHFEALRAPSRGDPCSADDDDAPYAVVKLGIPLR